MFIFKTLYCIAISFYIVYVHMPNYSFKFRLYVSSAYAQSSQLYIFNY